LPELEAPAVARFPERIAAPLLFLAAAAVPRDLAELFPPRAAAARVPPERPPLAAARDPPDRADAPAAGRRPAEPDADERREEDEDDERDLPAGADFRVDFLAISGSFREVGLVRAG